MNCVINSYTDKCTLVDFLSNKVIRASPTIIVYLFLEHQMLLIMPSGFSKRTDSPKKILKLLQYFSKSREYYSNFKSIFLFKKLSQLLLYQFFLSLPDFFFYLILSVSHRNQTQNTKQNLILKINFN